MLFPSTVKFFSSTVGDQINPHANIYSQIYTKFVTAHVNCDRGRCAQNRIMYLMMPAYRWKRKPMLQTAGLWAVEYK